MARVSRNTKQKRTIQNEIDKLNSFFSAEELHKKVSKHDKTIGIATVYRYLKEEKKKNNLFLYLCDRKNLYSKGKKNHCHFHCEETGKSFHFDLEDISFLKDKIPGKISSIQLEVRGVCEKCN